MKYISGIAGVILLIYLLSMQQISIFGRVCYVAGSQKRGELWGGDVFCLNPGLYFTGLFVAAALILLAIFLFAKDASEANQSTSSSTSYSTSYSSSYRPAERQPTPVSTAPATKTYDIGKWAALKEFDADVGAAAKEMEKLGGHAEDRLATAFLAVNDKSLLPSMVAKITADEAEAAVAREKADEEKKRSWGDRTAKLVVEREERARATLAELKSNGMILGGKKVVTAEMHDGDTPHLQGWLKIVYEDGSKELRAGDSWTRL